LERKFVGHGRCKNGDDTIVHGVEGHENYIILVVECIFENYEKLKLFISNPFAQFLSDFFEFCFWLIKHVLFNDYKESCPFQPMRL
jgi:hypothetical protein